MKLSEAVNKKDWAPIIKAAAAGGFDYEIKGKYPSNYVRIAYGRNVIALVAHRIFPEYGEGKMGWLIQLKDAKGKKFASILKKQEKLTPVTTTIKDIMRHK